MSVLTLMHLSRPVSIAQDEVHKGTDTIFPPVLKAREEWRLCCLVLISHGLRWVFKHLFAVLINANYLCISVVLEFLRWAGRNRGLLSWCLFFCWLFLLILGFNLSLFRTFLLLFVLVFDRLFRALLDAQSYQMISEYFLEST